MTIIDLNGLSVLSASRDLYGLTKQVIQILNDYYPETMGNLFLINAPYLFYGVWSCIKGFLGPTTRSKIRVIGEDFMPALEEFLQVEDIPSFLGGKCTCSEFEGGCLQSNIGPWNEYELDRNCT